jgi:hypothetical protein
MVRRHGFIRDLKSAAGMALLGLGLLLLAGNMSGAAAQLSRLFGMSAEATQAFGGLIAAGLAASQLWRSYLFDRQELLLGVWKILISFWPLSLVLAGAVLTGMALPARASDIENKKTGTVDLTAARSTRQ